MLKLCAAAKRHFSAKRASEHCSRQCSHVPYSLLNLAISGNCNELKCFIYFFKLKSASIDRILDRRGSAKLRTEQPNFPSTESTRRGILSGENSKSSLYAQSHRLTNSPGYRVESKPESSSDWLCLKYTCNPSTRRDETRTSVPAPEFSARKWSRIELRFGSRLEIKRIFEPLNLLGQVQVFTIESRFEIEQHPMSQPFQPHVRKSTKQRCKVSSQFSQFPKLCWIFQTVPVLVMYKT